MFGSPSLAVLGHLLSFSAGVMVYISFADIFVESVIRDGMLLTNLAV